jgi:hypothetical protein
MSTRFFVFNKVKKDETKRLKEAKSIPETRKILAEIFDDYISTFKEKETTVDFNYKKEIILDLFYNTVFYAESKAYNEEKTSCLLELIYRVFRTSIEKILTFEKSFELAKEYLLRHALFRPPHSIMVFSLDDIKDITDFLINNFLRNYSLYMKCFAPFIDYEIGTFTMYKSRFPPVMSLSDGEIVDKDDYTVLDQYNKDKEIKLTREEILEIMKGESIHNIPEWKKQEIIQKFLEQERQAKIDRVLKKELEKLHEKFLKKVQEQDEWFNEKLASLKPKK